MANVKIVDIKGNRWDIKDENARTRIETIEEKINKNFTYSTEEVDTGEKWIDGKPIYRLVFPINFVYTDSMRTVTKDIYNAAHVIKCYGVDYNKTNGCIYFRGWSKNGYLQAMSEYHSGSCTHVIFEYTKTTD